MRNKTMMVAAGLALLTALPAFAQKQSPPEGSAPKDFTLPAKTIIVLENGLRVTMVPYGSVPKVQIRAVVRAGNGNESANEVWLADIVADMLKEATTTRTAKQIAEDAARLGGSIAVSVGDDQTSVTGDVLSEFAPAMAELMADVLCNPAFPESELARIKNDKLRDLSIQKTDPNAIAVEKFRAVLYPDHPYGRTFPTEAMLSGYTIAQLKNFYAANFGAERTHIFVAGKFDLKAMEAAIRKAFGSWTRGTPPVTNVPKSVAKRMIYLVDRPGAPQSTVYIGLPVIDPSNPDYRALVLTNSLLGGSFASRITSNIRESKGYTYSPGSTVSSRFRDAYWAEFASVTTDVTGPAIKEILFEINRLQGEAPTEEELQGFKNYLSGTFVLQNSNPGGIINQLVFLNLHGLPDSYLTEYVKTIHAITPAQVQKMAQTYLRDEEMVIVIAGDRKKIEKQLAAFGKIVG
jgi:zinc protease